MRIKIFVLLLSLFSVPCFSQKTFSFEKIDSLAVLRRIGDPRENYTLNSHDFDGIITQANSILNNAIVLGDTWEPYSYDKTIPWSKDPYKNTSWLNYLFSLRMVGILSKAHEIKANNEYLSKAIQILDSWSLYYNNVNLPQKKKNLIWNDHAVANRVINITHLLHNLNKYEEIEKTNIFIYSHLIECTEWLYDNKNYTHGNHAVMMDRALLYVSFILKNHERSELWKKRALERFEKIINQEVTQSGVCVENSPQYHPFMMNLLDDFIHIIELFDEVAPQKYTQLYQKMKTYLVYVLKPDLIYPFQGDTYPISEALYYSNIYTDKRLKYIETKGLEGQKPSKVDLVYKDAGYAILRDSWSTGKEFEASTYINFTSGFPSRVHKHSDNLSFVLYANHENLLVDPGSWGYSNNDTVNYLKSTFAHNTFTVNQTNYTNYPLKSCEITYSKLEKNYSIVKGKFQPNPFQTLYRTIIFIKPNIIVVDDYMYAEDGVDSYSQIFNLGPKVKEIVKKETKSLEAIFEKNTVTITQLLEQDYNIDLYKGEKTTRGLYALKAEKTINGNQVVFTSKLKEKTKTFNSKALITIDNNLVSNNKNATITHNRSSFTIKWENAKKQLKELTITNSYPTGSPFSKIINSATRHPISSPNNKTNFGIEALYVKNWRKNEYSLLFKLKENTTVDELKKITLAIKGTVSENQKTKMSTYARHKNRDFEYWNVKSDNYITTSEGKFIHLNISTKISNFNNLILSYYDRSGYITTLWKHEFGEFIIDEDACKKALIFEFNKSESLLKEHLLTPQLALNHLSIKKITSKKISLMLKFDGDISQLNKYRIGLHAYVEEEDFESLSEYSKSKNRLYNSWDFEPKPIIIDEQGYIKLEIDSDLNKIKKLKLFLYDQFEYNGVVGSLLEMNTIIIK